MGERPRDCSNCLTSVGLIEGPAHAVKFSACTCLRVSELPIGALVVVGVGPGVSSSNNNGEAGYIAMHDSRSSVRNQTTVMGYKRLRKVLAVFILLAQFPDNFGLKYQKLIVLVINRTCRNIDHHLVHFVRPHLHSTRHWAVLFNTYTFCGPLS